MSATEILLVLNVISISTLCIVVTVKMIFQFIVVFIGCLFVLKEKRKDDNRKES